MANQVQRRDAMKFLRVLAFSTCLLAQQQSTLTDSKLMGLAQAGVSEAELLRMVATAPKIDFDLQPVATDTMLKAGVSERVIKAMAAREDGALTPSAVTPSDGRNERAAGPLPSNQGAARNAECCVSSNPSQLLGDSEIQSAIDRTSHQTAKDIWRDIKSGQKIRINRAGFGDPIEKKVTLLFDRDRIALEAAERRRQMRPDLTVDEVKRIMPLGITEVLLEANCYNNLYESHLPNWSTEGRVHVVLVVDGQVIQPVRESAGRADSVSILATEHVLITQNGPFVSYTPLYRSAIYERSSSRAWFLFPALNQQSRKITILVIGGDGHKKEKEIDNPLQQAY